MTQVGAIYRTLYMVRNERLGPYSFPPNHPAKCVVARQIPGGLKVRDGVIVLFRPLAVSSIQWGYPRSTLGIESDSRNRKELLN